MYHRTEKGAFKPSNFKCAFLPCHRLIPKQASRETAHHHLLQHATVLIQRWCNYLLLHFSMRISFNCLDRLSKTAQTTDFTQPMVMLTLVHFKSPYIFMKEQLCTWLAEMQAHLFHLWTPVANRPEHSTWNRQEQLAAGTHSQHAFGTCGEGRASKL